MVSVWRLLSGRDSSTKASAAADSRGSDHGVVQAVLALLGFVMATVLVMWPALSDNSNTVMGDIQPNDATAGGVWQGWQLASLTPFSAHTSILNAPFGAAFWHSIDVTALGWILPQWLFAHIFGSVGSWNVTLALGFVTDGMAMFGLVRWLVRSDWVAFVAGLLYAFSPFHVEESYAHIGYVYSWIFPLILWAGLAFIARPSGRRSPLLGLTVAVAAYVDGYYIVFALLLAAIVAACGLVGAAALGVDRRRLVIGLAQAGVVYAVVVMPVLVLSSQVSQNVIGAFGRSQQYVYFYSARFWEYFIPWTQSVIWGSLVTHTVNSLLGRGRGSGVLERSLYLGGVVIILAVALWVGMVRKGRVGSWDRTRIPIRLLGWTLLACAAVTMVCSFASVGPIPGFPILVWYIVPIWRVYTRLFVVVDCAVVVAATVTLAYLYDAGQRSNVEGQRSKVESGTSKVDEDASTSGTWGSRLGWSPRWWRLAAPVLAMLALADGGAFLPWSGWSYAANTPIPYHWLAAHQGGIVADYPMLRPPKWAYETYLAYQPYYRHPLFNGAAPGTFANTVESGLQDLSDPQTIPALRHFGVRYIVIDSFFYRHRPYLHAHLDLRGVRKIDSQFSFTLYRIVPGQPSIGMVRVNSGFYLEMPGIPHMHRWMSSATAELGILPFTSWSRARFSCLVSSWLEPRELRVSQNGVVLWHGEVPAGSKPTRISFLVARHGPLVLRANPGPTFAKGFQGRHSFALDIYDLSLSPEPGVGSH